MMETNDSKSQLFYNSKLFSIFFNPKLKSDEDKIRTKIEEYLQSGADVNAINLNDEGNTTLHVAISKNYVQVVTFLLQIRDIRADIENKGKVTALMLALKANEKIKYLMKEYIQKIHLTLKLNYSSDHDAFWEILSWKPNVWVLEIDSLDSSPDFLFNKKFYDAISCCEHLFFVNADTRDDENDKSAIENQLKSTCITKQLILQFGLWSDKIVCFSSEDGGIEILRLNNSVTDLDEEKLNEHLLSNEKLSFKLMLKALKLELIGKQNSEHLNLISAKFDLVKVFGNLTLLEHVIKNGDLITFKLLCLHIKKMDLSVTILTLTSVAKYGDTEKISELLVIMPLLPGAQDLATDNVKNCLLKISAEAGNVKIVRFMLNIGVKPSELIITIAWDNKKYKVVLLLLKADSVFPCDFNLKKISEHDETLSELTYFVQLREQLHEEIKHGDLDKIKNVITLIDELNGEIGKSRIYLDENNHSAVRTALDCKHDQAVTIYTWLKQEKKAMFREENDEQTIVDSRILDSATEALLETCPPIENAHIMNLVSKSKPIHIRDNFVEEVQNYYLELDQHPEISIILKVVQFCDQLNIFFDFEDSRSGPVFGECDYFANNCFIKANVEKKWLLGTLAHELTHLAMQKVFNNHCRPYNSETNNRYKDIIKSVSKNLISKDKIIRRVFDKQVYKEEGMRDRELIVRVNHMLAAYGIGEGNRLLTKQVPELLQYYREQVVPKCREFIDDSPRMSIRNHIRMLNDYSGVMNDIKELNIELKSRTWHDEPSPILCLATDHVLLSAIRVLNSFKDDMNSILVFYFDRYLAQRKYIHTIFSYNVCKTLIILCEAEPHQFTHTKLYESLERLSNLVKQKLNKKVIVIIKKDCELEGIQAEVKIVTDTAFSISELTPDSVRILLQQSPVYVQTKKSALKEFIDEDSFHLVDPETLIKLIRKERIDLGKVTLDDCNYDEKCYMDRMLDCGVVLDEKVLQTNSDNTIFAISKVDKDPLQLDEDETTTFDNVDLNRPKKFVILGQSEEQMRQFHELCQLFPTKDIHWLKRVESDETHWCKSRCVQGGISELKKNSVKDLSFGETELINNTVDHRIVLVSDTAGVGKTTLLTNVARLIKLKYPLVWVVRLNLNDCIKALEEVLEMSVNTSDDNALDVLIKLVQCKTKTRFETQFEIKLFSHLITKKQDKIVIMFDGLDEIKKKYQRVVMRLLLFLKSTNVKQMWVMARPHLKADLEMMFHHYSFTLKPFSANDQVNFLIKFWALSTSIKNKVKAKCYAKALTDRLSETIRDREKSFTGIPLQCKMLAVNYKTDFQAFYHSDENTPTVPDKIDLIHLYKKFFKEKFVIYQREKNKINVNLQNVSADNEIVRRQFLRNHQLASLYTLFPEDKSMMLTENEVETVTGFINEIITEERNTGLIETIVNGTPRFVHQTFAEYLAAEFLVQKLSLGSDLNVSLMKFVMERILYARSFTGLRAFIDSHLARVQPESKVFTDRVKYMAIIWKLGNQNKDQPIVFRDGEQTVLHVAAGEGNANIVKFILKCAEVCELKKNILECKNSNGDEALHLAAFNNQIEVVDILLCHGANITAVNNAGHTAQQLISDTNDVNVMKHLLKHAYSQTNTVDEIGRTPVQLAVKYNQFQTAELRPETDDVVDPPRKQQSRGANSGKYIVFSNTCCDATTSNNDDDIEIIQTTFQELGFTGEIFTNSTFIEIQKRLKNAFRNHPSDYGSLIVYFLTRGTRNAKLRALDEDYNLETLVEFAMYNAGKGLSGKPKIFIVQAPGCEPVSTGIMSNPKDRGPEKDKILPIFADMFIAYAAKPGSFKFVNSSKTFVKVLCNIVNQQGSWADWETMVDLAGEQIKNNLERVNDSSIYRPTTVAISTLTKVVLMPLLSNSFISPPCKMEYYQTTNLKPGKTLVFNHENFKYFDVQPRFGTDKDVKSISTTFKKIGFEVSAFNDLKRQKVEDVLRQEIGADFTNYGSLFIFFLTHGEDDYVLHASDESYHFKMFVDEMLMNANPTLIGKPIVFIIQSCTGSKFDTGVCSIRNEGILQNSFKFLLPEVPDMLFFFASFPGYVAFRNAEVGTWLIQSLCKNINEKYPQNDLLDILTFTRQQISGIGTRNLKQMPISISTLTKKYR